MFTHGAPRSSQEFVQKCPCIPDRIRIWKCWFLRRGENRSTRRKTSRSRVGNQQQTQPTYDTGSGNRTRNTLVRGERSHHCAISAFVSLELPCGFSMNSNWLRFIPYKCKFNHDFLQLRIPEGLNSPLTVQVVNRQ